MTDQGIGAGKRGAAPIAGERLRGDFDGRPFQELLRRRFRNQQRTELTFERLVTGAGALEKRVALLERTLQHGLEQAIELFPAIQVHRRFHR